MVCDTVSFQAVSHSRCIGNCEHWLVRVIAPNNDAQLLESRQLSIVTEIKFL